jgi:hypothetical protein
MATLFAPALDALIPQVPSRSFSTQLHTLLVSRRAAVLLRYRRPCQTSISFSGGKRIGNQPFSPLSQRDREFESISLRERVPVSVDSLLKPPKWPAPALYSHVWRHRRKAPSRNLRARRGRFLCRRVWRFYPCLSTRWLCVNRQRQASRPSGRLTIPPAVRAGPPAGHPPWTTPEKRKLIAVDGGLPLRNRSAARVGSLPSGIFLSF